MKHKKLLSASFLAAALLLSTGAAKAADACTVLLCLATSVFPTECSGPVQDYLREFAEKPWEAGNFLSTCNMSGGGGVDARVIAQAYGHCDAKSLNIATKYSTWTYRDDMRIETVWHHPEVPKYCTDYQNMVAGVEGVAPDQASRIATHQAHFVRAPDYTVCTMMFEGKCKAHKTVTPPVDAGHWVD